MRQAQTRRNGWRWLALAVGTLSALSLAEASMARNWAGWPFTRRRRWNGP
ncbi:hypothetical protein DZ915_030760, partial [Pseudomonas aeruginosa]|nr:hypothetical protein [Pseudomonas aeruginosa]